jgi:hypothetical protein
MKLHEIADDTPMIIIMLQTLLKKGEHVDIRDRDGNYSDLTIVTQRKLDGVWVIRGVGEPTSKGAPKIHDLRLPADAEADYLLDLQKASDGWTLIPNWERIRELGYQ